MGTSTRGLRSGLIAGIVVGALMIGVPATAQAQQQACTPGASGVGNEYYPEYGNGGYDVDHYDLDIAYNPFSDRLKGLATISATATQNLCSFNLDFVGLRIQGLKVDGEKARWSRDEHELTVVPDRDLERGSDFEVVVRYAGEPTEFVIPGLDIRTGFMDTPEGATVAGQPEVAAGWFPVNDHPIDKASYSFDVTVPDPYEVVANGFLRDTEHRGHKTTWEWEAAEPMASYLATIDIADWDVHEWTTDDGLPVYDAVDTNITGALRAEIDSSFARQGEIIDMLEEFAGPYPFSTAGGIVPNQDDLFFALETQTRSVYSKLFWINNETGEPENGDFVVVHEMAHQWYGRRRRGRALEGNLAQRGLRHLHRVAVGGARGSGDAAADLPGDLRCDSRRRPVLAHRGCRSGRRGPVRQPELRARSDDPAGAAQRGRRRRLLRDRAPVGPEHERRQRHHRGVHRPRRADLGRAARRPVRRLALHAREAAGLGDDGGPEPRGTAVRAGQRVVGWVAGRRAAPAADRPLLRLSAPTDG